LFARWGLYATGVDISPQADIGPGLLVVHGVGTVIGGLAKVGSDATILHQVTLGSPRPDRREAMPSIGDRVFLAAGAKVIGPVSVGDDVFIGVDALVVRDVPSRSKVVAVSDVRVEAWRGAAATEPAGPASAEAGEVVAEA
jgi:serine O-acetyltransferase